MSEVYPAVPSPMPGDAFVFGKLPGEFPDISTEIVQHATGSFAAHVEIYLGHGKSFASRNGVGVNIYNVRLDDLVWIGRPNVPLDFDSAAAWIETVRGEAYDWLGLLNAETPGVLVEDRKLFCSAAAVNYYRKARFDVVHPEAPACKIWPAHFPVLPGFTHIYRVSGAF